MEYYVWTALDLANKLAEAREMFQSNLTRCGSKTERADLSAKIFQIEKRLADTPCPIEGAPDRKAEPSHCCASIAFGRKIYKAEAPTAREAYDLLYMIQGRRS